MATTVILVACQALFIRKDDPYALVARARTYARMGIVKESLDDVNTVLKEDPDNHQVCIASDSSSTFSQDIEENSSRPSLLNTEYVYFATEWCPNFIFSCY